MGVGDPAAPPVRDTVGGVGVGVRDGCGAAVAVAVGGGVGAAGAPGVEDGIAGDARGRDVGEDDAAGIVAGGWAGGAVRMVIVSTGAGELSGVFRAGDGVPGAGISDDVMVGRTGRVPIVGEAAALALGTGALIVGTAVGVGGASGDDPQPLMTISRPTARIIARARWPNP